VLKLLAEFPEARAIVVETNQGGDLWADVFAGIPLVKVVQTHSTAPKEVRFATALEHWQRHRVHHARPFATLEEQAVGFPRAAYDDVIDAAAAGVSYFLDPPKLVKAGAKVAPYVRSA
jgi:phage terminase large subunit-like protein